MSDAEELQRYAQSIAAEGYGEPVVFDESDIEDLRDLGMMADDE